MNPDRAYVYKSTIKAKLAQWVDAVGNRFFASSSHPVTWNEVKKIAFLRLDHLGDFILALPAFEALTRALPETKIDVIVHPSSKGIAEISGLNLNPVVLKVPWFDKEKKQKWSRRFLKELGLLLRRGSYDAVIDVGGDLRHIIAMKRSGIPLRIATGRMGLGFTLTCRVRFSPGLHEIENNFDFLEQAGLKLPEKSIFPRLFPSDENEKTQKIVADRLGILNPAVVIHAISPNPSKRWPVENWQRLIEKLPGDVDIVLIGSKEEEEEIKQIQKGCDRKFVQSPGLFSLPELAAFLGKCRLFIGVDSGPGHIAAAMEAPVISLFSGAGLLSRWAPRGSRVTVIQKEAPCSPCELTHCPFNNECMRRISVSEVSETAQSWLNKPLSSDMNNQFHLSQKEP
jgi:ADP-heptose:LPS heptosyltransferase